jgi:outer membrane protein OmpA-like peptidoglycan-associated protein
VLRKKPDSTARIEGHADKTAKSKEKYNVKLSERRARSVLEYLVDRGGIERSRMTSHGYGFARPKVPNDPQDGNPLNRRVEVYIRGAALIEE